MAILKTSNKDSPKKFKHLGIRMLKEDVDYLSLYSVAKGFGKSLLVREVLEDLVQKKKNQYSTNDLVGIIVTNIKSSYKLACKQTSPAPFLNQLNFELTQKGVNQETIKIIINKLKDEAD